MIPSVQWSYSLLLTNPCQSIIFLIFGQVQSGTHLPIKTLVRIFTSFKLSRFFLVHTSSVRHLVSFEGGQPQSSTYPASRYTKVHLGTKGQQEKTSCAIQLHRVLVEV